MNNEKITEILARIRELLGTEASALISAELTEILSGVDSLNKTINTHLGTIAEVEAQKQGLLDANNKMLLQIGSTVEVTNNSNNDINEEQEQMINLETDLFDEKGNFLK